MGDYSRTTDFASKDALATGNPGKIIKGTEIGAEFDNIATMSAEKADLPASASIANFAGFADVAGNLADSGKAIPTGVVVGTTDTQTLSAKTLTAPDINGGTVDAITSLTVANNVDIGSFELRAQTFESDIVANAGANPPFVVASDDLVVNLNADKLDGYDESAFGKLADNETVTGNWTFSGTVDLNSQANKVVMLTTPEALSMNTEGAWTGIAPTGTTGQTDIIALIVKIKIRATASSAGAAGSGNYVMTARATTSDGEHEVCDCWVYNGGVGTGTSSGSDSNTAIIKADGNGDFDYYLTKTEDTDITLANKSVTAALVGYIKSV